ncbi:MAG TPA: hypothetical protein PKD51_13120 [Saprospiraceae bacterium]|nr:hypothetical protein [Saprospiraceae bacterium]HMU03256.1 hypothetical protein [Saprospiraceae bacterium]
MNVQVKIINIKTVNELGQYWTNDDFIQLLDKMNLPDADKIKPEELKDLLYMAITDFEPNEAAEIVLTYKLGETLTPGQIQTIAHEMTDEKVAEQYADPSYHYDLFNINQLLFKAYNGTFPNTEASIITIQLTDANGGKVEVNNEILTKALSAGLSDRSIIKRLYEDQMEGLTDFGDADKILWRYQDKGNNTYEIITSRYWIDKEDIESGEYDAEIKFYEEKD